MPDTSRFRPNNPSVLHETIDDETILVNLETGTYYSLNAAGTSLWGAIDRGASVEEVVEGIAEQSGGEVGAIESSVTAFIDQLVSEELLVARNGDGPSEPVRAEWPRGLNFEQPALSRYTDMQELLLLDPVHDVGVAGWSDLR